MRLWHPAGSVLTLDFLVLVFLRPIADFFGGKPRALLADELGLDKRCRRLSYPQL